MIKSNYERNFELYSDHKNGLTLRQLSKKYGITRTRVCAIISTLRQRERERNSDLYMAAYNSYPDDMSEYEKDEHATAFVKNCRAHECFNVNDVMKMVGRYGTRYIFYRQGYYMDRPIQYILENYEGGNEIEC